MWMITWCCLLSPLDLDGTNSAVTTASHEMQLSRRCHEFVAEFGMDDRDQRLSAFRRGQPFEIHGTELGHDAMRVDARCRDRPLEPATMRETFPFASVDRVRAFKPYAPLARRALPVRAASY
jgi:hypothetical protein